MIKDYKSYSDKGELSRILRQLTEELDITKTQREDAVAKYKAVADYLGRDEKINAYEPDIYPQGSFNLGTVTKPKTDENKYDIDLVCELKKGSSKFLTQEDLKNLIGDRLKSGFYKDKLKDLEGGKRCWTIEYAEETQFHLDILPAIPDLSSRLLFENLENDYGSTAIGITDKENDNYYLINDDWVKSNPKGYLAWFKEQMLLQLNESKKMFAEMNNVNVDDVPFYNVKTPLQRVIQLLKRHRDTTCADDDDKPISIIITTLAAHSYGNESNLYEALMNILKGMRNYIKYKYNEEGKRIAWIENPVDSRENFADKWEKFPKREKVFYNWLQNAQDYFDKLFNEESKDIKWLNESLSDGFGEEITRRTFSSLGKDVLQQRKKGNLGMELSTGLLGVNLPKESSKKVKNHTFHGNGR